MGSSISAFASAVRWICLPHNFVFVAHSICWWETMEVLRGIWRQIREVDVGVCSMNWWIVRCVPWPAAAAVNQQGKAHFAVLIDSVSLVASLRTYQFWHAVCETIVLVVCSVIHQVAAPSHVPCSSIIYSCILGMQRMPTCTCNWMSIIVTLPEDTLLKICLMDGLTQISFLLRYQSVAAITNFLSALRSHGISVLDFCFLESVCRMWQGSWGIPHLHNIFKQLWWGIWYITGGTFQKSDRVGMV
jgi:hypothetical protein